MQPLFVPASARIERHQREEQVGGGERAGEGETMERGLQAGADVDAEVVHAVVHAMAAVEQEQADDQEDRQLAEARSAAGRSMRS